MVAPTPDRSTVNISQTKDPWCLKSTFTVQMRVYQGKNKERYKNKTWLSNFTLKAKGNAILHPKNNEKQAITVYFFFWNYKQLPFTCQNTLEIYLTTQLFQQKFKASDRRSTKCNWISRRRESIFVFVDEFTPYENDYLYNKSYDWRRIYYIINYNQYNIINLLLVKARKSINQCSSQVSAKMAHMHNLQTSLLRPLVSTSSSCFSDDTWNKLKTPLITFLWGSVDQFLRVLFIRTGVDYELYWLQPNGHNTRKGSPVQTTLIPLVAFVTKNSQTPWAITLYFASALDLATTLLAYPSDQVSPMSV